MAQPHTDTGGCATSYHATAEHNIPPHIRAYLHVCLLHSPDIHPLTTAHIHLHTHGNGVICTYHCITGVSHAEHDHVHLTKYSIPFLNIECFL